MILYRLTKYNYADLSGTGARLYGGRWNSEGKPMVYFASSRSLSILEALAHLGPTNLPDDFYLTTVNAPDNFTGIKIQSLPENWYEFPEPNVMKELGNQFLEANEHLFARVPSAIVKEEWNYLLNPRHPDAKSVKIISSQRFCFGG